MKAINTISMIAGLEVPVWRAGKGPPLLILHRDFGSSGSEPFLERLAERFDVVAPTLPGFAGAGRPDWARHVRDLGGLLQLLVRDVGLVRPAVLGLGFGGWIAAEMASLAPQAFSAMVLVGSMGIKPEEGEILDQFLIHSYEYIRAGLHNPATFDALFGAEPSVDLLEQWDINREMTSRIAWKPYMYNRALAPLLKGCAMPSLIVWGDDDRVVPLEVGKAFASTIPDARIEIVANCGHLVELEKPESLADLVGTFFG